MEFIACSGDLIRSADIIYIILCIEASRRAMRFKQTFRIFCILKFTAKTYCTTRSLHFFADFGAIEFVLV